eukprot:scaffold4523_cov63-Phaeocystis_antarctica.AAC.5
MNSWATVSAGRRLPCATGSSSLVARARLGRAHFEKLSSSCQQKHHAVDCPSGSDSRSLTARFRTQSATRACRRTHRNVRADPALPRAAGAGRLDGTQASGGLFAPVQLACRARPLSVCLLEAVRSTAKAGVASLGTWFTTSQFSPQRQALSKTRSGIAEGRAPGRRGPAGCAQSTGSGARGQLRARESC